MLTMVRELSAAAIVVPFLFSQSTAIDTHVVCVYAFR